jgi:hypothetical protein
MFERPPRRECLDPTPVRRTEQEGDQMRRYDDPVDVRKGQVPGTGGGPVEGPEQFVWKGRLWKVHAVLAQWVETGPWWQSSGAHAVLGDDGPDGPDGPDGLGPVGGGTRTMLGSDLSTEREVWRVEADRGMAVDLGRGVFDLVFDWADGSWRLTRCLD